MLKTTTTNIIIAFYVNLWYDFYIKYRREVYRCIQTFRHRRAFGMTCRLFKSTQKE